MRVEELSIPELRLIHLERHADSRGEFVETYARQSLSMLGVDVEFVLDAYSVSTSRGTVRGLHFQIPPRAQAKLVRVAKGRVFDVVVDLRRGAQTFGRHVTMTLEADDGRQLFIPAGFAHGFCTLEDDTRVEYKLSDYFSPEHYRGLRWNDPDVGVAWPVSEGRAVVSEQDDRHPRLADMPEYFHAVSEPISDG